MCLHVYFRENVRSGRCGFTVALLCDLNVHQRRKVRKITNQHFFRCNVCQRDTDGESESEREQERERELVRGGFYHRELLPLGEGVWGLYQRL